LLTSLFLEKISDRSLFYQVVIAISLLFFARL
jgi:hypothetical protein